MFGGVFALDLLHVKIVYLDTGKSATRIYQDLAIWSRIYFSDLHQLNLTPIALSMQFSCILRGSETF